MATTEVKSRLPLYNACETRPNAAPRSAPKTSPHKASARRGVGVRGGVAEVLFLLAAIAATAAFFSKASRMAALLLVPHLPWTRFASVLTFSVWRLNSQGHR